MSCKTEEGKGTVKKAARKSKYMNKNEHSPPKNKTEADKSTSKETVVYPKRR